MSRHSTIQRLPPALRAEIARLWDAGHTLDEIIAHLRTLTEAAPSRSALGRHVQKMEVLGARMRRSREVAEALVAKLGDAPESRTARLNIELLHSAIMDLFMSEEEDAGDEDGRAALAGNPQGVMLLAKALDHLTRAQRSDVVALRLAEERAAKRAKTEAAEAGAAAARAQGLSAATIEAIKQRILGVTP